jgi:hypothetical protein
MKPKTHCLVFNKKTSANSPEAGTTDFLKKPRYCVFVCFTSANTACASISKDGSNLSKNDVFFNKTVSPGGSTTASGD